MERLNLQRFGEGAEAEEPEAAPEQTPAKEERELPEDLEEKVGAIADQVFSLEGEE